MSKRSFDYKKKMNNKKKLHSKQVRKILMSSAVASTLVFQPFIPVIQNGQLIGFIENSASADPLINVGLFENVDIGATLTEPENSDFYNLNLSLTSGEVANIELVDPSKTILFYAPELAGSLTPNGLATVRADILPITIPADSTLGNLLSGVTGTVGNLITGLTTTLDATINGTPLAGLVTVQGLDELALALENLNNLSESIESLTSYTGQEEVTINNTDGTISVDFENGLGNHLEGVISDVLTNTITDLGQAVGNIRVELLRDSGLLGPLLNSLIINPIVNPLLRTVGQSIDALTSGLDTAVVELVNSLALAQVIGSTYAELNVNVDKNTTATGTVPVYGAVVATPTIDVSLLSTLVDSTAVQFPAAPDTEAPAAPVVNPVGEGAAEITGTAEPGSTVNVGFPGGVSGTTTAAPDGTFTVAVPDGTELVAGDELEVTATDASGNESLPTTVVVADVTDPVVSPIENATAVEGVEIAPIDVEVSEDSTVTAAGLPTGLAYDDTTGAISGTPTVDDWAEGELSREFPVVVSAEDGSGNTGTAEFVLTVQRDSNGDGIPDLEEDTTAPEAPAVDPVNDDATEVTGTAEPDSIITITLPNGDEVTGETDGNGDFVVTLPEDLELAGGDELDVTATDASGNESLPTTVVVADVTDPVVSPIENATAVEGVEIAPIDVEVSEDSTVTAAGLPTGLAYDDTTGEISGTPTVDDWAEGELSREFPVVVTAEDGSGNTGTAEFVLTVQRDSDGDGIPDLEEDTDAPAAPSVDSVGEGATEVTGEAEPNSEITITLPNGDEVTGTTDEDGEFVVVLPEDLELSVGDELEVVATDEAGNTSEPTIITVEDLTAPDTPIVNEVTSEDTTVDGTAEPGSEVIVTLPNGETVSGVTDEDGNFSVVLPEDLDLTGGEVLEIVARDEAGNISDPEFIRVTDRTAPIILEIEDQRIVEGTEIENVNIVVENPGEENQEPDLAAQGFANFAIRPFATPLAGVFVENLPEGLVFASDVEEEEFVISGVPVISDWGETEEERDLAITVIARDEAGNEATEIFTITVLRDSDGDGIPDIEEDTTAPDAPTVEPVTDESTEVIGEAESNIDVTITLPNGETVTGRTDEDGNFTVTLPEDLELNVGDELSVVVTDEAGNVSEPTIVTVEDATPEEVDTTAPEAPTVEPVTDESTEVVGEAEPNTDVTITLPNGDTITGRTDEDGDFVIALPEDLELEVGDELTVVVTDEAGNSSEPLVVVVTDGSTSETPTDLDEDGTPTDGNNGTGGNGQGNGSSTGGGQSDDTAGGKDQESLPQTGESQSMLAVMSGSVMAAISTMMLAWNKRKKGSTKRK